MSVAFRRESDEEHLEPKFELPIPPGLNLVTPRGLSMIEARVAELEGARNAEPNEEKRKPILRDLRYWHQRQATAQLAPPANGVLAAFGTRVTFSREGVLRTLALVGHDESHPATGHIAFTAPLARALIGAKVGEEVDYGDASLTITSVEVIEG